VEPESAEFIAKLSVPKNMAAVMIRAEQENDTTPLSSAKLRHSQSQMEVTYFAAEKML
jgi:hypothetical protein